MNYIYDILLNFKEQYYDFYDWNKSDNIFHIRKIPIFRISKNDLYNVKNNNIKLDISFLEKICDKTELFTQNGVKKIKYACLLSDDSSIIAINIIQKKIKISSLLVDEELDSLEDVFKMNIENIPYLLLKKNNTDELKTRKQIEENKYIRKGLDKIASDEGKLKYLYYECFNKKEENINKIIVELSNISNEKIINRMFKFFKLIKVNK